MGVRVSAAGRAQARYDNANPYDLSARDLAEEAAEERRWLAPLRTLRCNARRSVRVDRDATGKLTFATLPAVAPRPAPPRAALGSQGAGKPSPSTETVQ